MLCCQMCSSVTHRFRVLIRLPHVKNCPFFLYEDEFIFALVFELCRGKEIRKRKARLSRFESAFVRETEIVLFVLCMCAIGDVVLQGAVRFVVVWLFCDFCINSEEYDTRLHTVTYILLLIARNCSRVSIYHLYCREKQ